MNMIVALLTIFAAGRGDLLPSHSAPGHDLRRLDAAEVQAALRGKRVSYSPPGWFDLAVAEEFRADGSWGGAIYGRAPMPFSGRWYVRAEQLCVVAERGLLGDHWQHGPVCRAVWRNRRNGDLLMNHLEAVGDLPMILSVLPLETR